MSISEEEMRLLFQDIVYHLEHSISIQRRQDLHTLLKNNGATHAEALDDPKLTHIITNSHRFEGWRDVAPTINVVTDKWIERSLILAKLMPPENYSPDPARIFSGVVACATQLPSPDIEVLSAGITALGGQWRTGLTKDVTHLFAITTTSNKYATALHFKEYTKIKILLPHWFDDAVRLGMGSLSTEPYEWPDPPLLRQEQLLHKPGPDDGLKKRFQKLDPEKKSIFRTALMSVEDGGSQDEAELPEVTVRDVWGGRRVLLSLRLGLREQMRDAVAVGIARTKGIPLTPQTKEDELEMIDQCDVLVARFRAGKAYVKAVRQGKTIGTLAWLFHVQGTGTISRPMDQLLHYPIPRRPIENFTGHEITVTNYTGEAREYLKKLIITMGATFTPSMSGRNTVLVAAFIGGTKTTKAAAWSIPIVNHTWLEDCFVKWRNLTVALEKYIVFTPGIDFSVQLGERGVSRVEKISEEELALLEADDDEPEEELPMDDEDDVRAPDAKMKGVQDNGTRKQGKGLTQGTQGSARDMREVEAAIMGDDNDDDELDANTGARGKNQKASKPQSKSKPKSKESPAKKGQSAQPSKKRTVTLVSDDEREEGEHRNSSPTPLPRKKGLIRRVSEAAPISDDEVEILGEVENMKQKQKGKETTTYGKGHRGKQVQAESQSSDEGVVAIMKTAKAKVKAKGKSRDKGGRDTDEDDDDAELRVEEVARKSPVKRKSLDKKSKSRQRKENGDEGLEEEEGDDDAAAEASAKPQPRSRTRGRKSDVDEPPRRKGSPTKTPSGKAVSVLMPSSPYDQRRDEEEMEVEDGSSKRKLSKGKGKETAVPARRMKAKRIVQDDEDESAVEPESEDDEEDEPPKKTKPTTREKSGHASKSKVDEKPTATNLPPPPVTPGPPPRPSHSSPATSAVRGSVQRSAAAKANRKLHDVIMPDVLNFEVQMRKHIKSGKSFGGAAAPEEVVAPVGLKAKGKKTKRDEDSGGEDADNDDKGEEVEQPARDRKRRKLSGTKKVEVDDDDDGDEDDVAQKATLPAKPKGKGAKDVPMDVDDGLHSDQPGRQSKPVMVMTTQVNLGDDVVKALTKLGVKMTTRPAECTHLIVSHLVRTEKFLCALAGAPYILTEKWVRDSVAAKKLQPEEGYTVQDTVNEAKYGFKLADALERAKQLHGTLFSRKTFYVTPKVPIDTKLLKNVVTASGGQISTQPPTSRILNANEDRYIISCPEDISIWRSIATAGHPVYSHELLLTSVLRQEVDWDNDAFKVPGSF